MFALAAFALVSSITPGPNNLMLMASGTNFGFRKTLPHLFGVTVGFTVMLFLVGIGLHEVFERLPILHTGLLVVSVVYLAILAWKLAMAAPPSAQQPSAAKPLTFLQAAAFQWVNPKAWTMALTACSAYVPLSRPLVGLVVVTAVFALVNLPSVGAWTLMGVQLRRFLADPRRLRIFNVSAALLLLASLYPVVTRASLP